MVNIISRTQHLGTLPAEAWGTVIASIAGMTTLLIIVIAWCLVWKGLALWRAARSGAKVWFIILLLVNTLGILDILYYFYIHSKKWGKK
jgi:methionyl-tRNA synthetase